MYRIFIVEDDRVIAGALKKHLEKWDYEVTLAEDFKDITGEFKRTKPDLLLLDIGLPFFNGFYWCERIREISKLPIIFISSANDKMNIVMAMNMGGDEFIEKPFDLHVATAKIQAILRRTYSFLGEASLMEYKGLILNLGEASASFGEEELLLTKNEFKILQTLMENGGHIVSRDDLIERLWESNSFIDENTLSVNVARLRRKLEGIGARDFILTKKGIGYMV